MSEEIPVKISREADDPLCHRISMGGSLEKGLYCVYRLGPEGGDRRDLIALIYVILEALKRAPRAEKEFQ